MISIHEQDRFLQAYIQVEGIQDVPTWDGLVPGTLSNHTCDETSTCPSCALKLRNATPEHRIVVIYGKGGWSRYFVFKTGEVVFSKSHCPRKVAVAEAAGFRIFE